MQDRPARRALLSDPENLLVAPGENSRAARKLPFHSVTEINAREQIIRAYVAEAIAIEKKSLKVDMPKGDLPLPAELTEALTADDSFAAAFDALTPGRRRSWILHVSQAKKPETRVSRIEKAAPKIRAGKGWNER